MHLATRWQVTLATDPTFASPVINELSFTELLTYTAFGLLPSTDYLVRAQHMDDEGVFSDFGAATPFTTLASNTIPVPINTEWAPCS